MAYSDEQKQEFSTRLVAVREGLKRRNIKYYAEAAKAIDPQANSKQLNNVMQGNIYNFAALRLLERVAGVVEPVAEDVQA
ncbi:hypothetical protein HER32_11820 [Hymenobacter sp. BT18]|uniref:hypothetical protein n=1 Tax=Hymenobacter sp. BT18 TaxID=2835648 RepID=UPI00143E42CD|nr:hypothetical protein [Hymenobacter sp. BT18]QIX61829.1 hypothetical protein HER32_11820 [Hymenobacter sp. BT18]